MLSRKTFKSNTLPHQINLLMYLPRVSLLLDFKVFVPKSWSMLTPWFWRDERGRSEQRLQNPNSTKSWGSSAPNPDEDVLGVCKYLILIEIWRHRLAQLFLKLRVLDDSVSFIEVCIMMRHRFVCIRAVLRIEILFYYFAPPLSHIIVIQLNWRYFQKILFRVCGCNCPAVIME